MADGLPEAYGWMLLVLAPLSFLAAIGVLWGTEVIPSVVDLARTRLGRALCAVAVVAVLVEGVWVARKVEAGRSVGAWADAVPDDGRLPAEYPRRSVPAPEFALVNQHGATVSPAAFRGRPVVVTFVFAHCQTMCPLVVEALKRAPGADVAEVLLVTLDPWRDTPSALAGIASRWQLPPRFHVLSSARVRDVTDVAEAYGVPFERDEKTGDVTHPGLVFVIDAGGRLAYTFNNPSAAWIGEALARAESTDGSGG